MKRINSVNEKWNKLIGVVGTPIMVFIFLSWCDAIMGINSRTMVICFSLGILIGSPNFVLGVIESVLGSLILLAIRDLFLKPIPVFWSNERFTWFDQQTACAGVFAVLAVMLIEKLIIKMSKE